MSDGHILLVSDKGQKVWFDPRVGQLADYLASGFREATEDEKTEVEKLINPK